MKRYRIDVAYDGTAYSGWQVQPDDISVQEMLEKVLLQLSGETVKVHGSGRTDSGVHARGQVAHFDLNKNFLPRKLLRGMNALLPPDIRVLRVLNVPDDFHARRSAVSKEYRYFIRNDESVLPFDRLYKLRISRKLDVNKMRIAAKYFEGEHDFSSFKANSGMKLASTVRTIYSCEIKSNGKDIVVIVSGSGFMYKMVRSIVGWLLEVGDGSRQPEETLDILNAKNRTGAVPSASAHGLFLWKVNYQ